MKWLRTLVLFDKGDVINSSDWESVHASYVRSIGSIDYPEGSGKLTLRHIEKKSEGSGRNGVSYLRQRFLDHIVGIEGWKSEVGFSLNKDRRSTEVMLFPSKRFIEEPITSTFGDFDLVTIAPNDTHIAIEWETGNISSSHRSMNKLAIALATGRIQAGALIVPSRELYKHLTDRVGNIGELSGYLSMWRGLGRSVKRGLLAITVVEHDAITNLAAHAHLPVGNDGRAKQGAARKQAAKKIFRKRRSSKKR